MTINTFNDLISVIQNGQMEIAITKSILCNKASSFTETHANRQLNEI